jgi:hypothetical protein
MDVFIIKEYKIEFIDVHEEYYILTGENEGFHRWREAGERFSTFRSTGISL